MASLNHYIANQIADARFVNSVRGTTNRKARRSVVKEEEHTQYLYSMATFKEATIGKVSGKTRPPRGKVGETYRENAQERVNEQDGTSTAEPLELLAQRRVPKWLTDKIIRKKIISYGYHAARIDKPREWIDFDGLVSAEDMIRVWNEAINDCLYGIRAPHSFDPFGYQLDIVEWAKSRFDAGETDILINAIMRAGKCLISYEIARIIGAQKVLVITGKPGVDDSWAELLPFGEKPHINYSQWKYHTYNKFKKNLLMLNTSECDVVFISLQYLNRHIDSNKEIIETIKNVNWDIVFFDEQHWATQTENTVNIFENITYRYKVELSGTPYKTLLSGRYAEENIRNFDYIDEQQIRNQAALDKDSMLWKQFQYRADINWAMLSVPDKVKSLISQEDGFTHEKLFAVDETGEFINLRAVEEYLSFVKRVAYKNSPGKFAKIKNLNQHSIWFLPANVRAIAALKVQLENDPYFSKYAILNASGGEVKDIDDVKTAIKNIEKLNKEGTITLTCDRFKEGVTVPQWQTVHQMNDNKSIESYLQGSFRCKSPWEEGKKESVLVYDYNPQRCIGTIYKIALDSKAQGQSTQSRIAQWKAVSDLYDYDSVWREVTGEEVIERANKDMSLHCDSFGDAEVPISAITQSVIDMMSSKDGKGSVTAKSDLNDNGIETGSNKTVVKGQQSKPSKQQKNELAETQIKIKTAIKKIPTLLFNSKYHAVKIHSMKDLEKCFDPEFVNIHTGLTPSEWGVIIKLLPDSTQEKINRRIDSFNLSFEIEK